MKHFQEQNKFNRIMHSKLGLLLLGVVVLFFAWNVLKFVVKMQDTARNKHIAEDKITQLQKEKERLTKDIDNLNTQNGVEETIRDKFGLAKDGEGLIVVVDNQDKTTNQTTETSTGFWAKIKSWFK